MATEQRPLAFGTLTDAALNSVYTVTAEEKIRPFLVLTNMSATQVDVGIIVNAGSGDLLLTLARLPAGVGKSVRVLEVSDLRISTGYVIKLQNSVAVDVNYFLSGLAIPDDD